MAKSAVKALDEASEGALLERRRGVDALGADAGLAERGGARAAAQPPWLLSDALRAHQHRMIAAGDHRLIRDAAIRDELGALAAGDDRLGDAAVAFALGALRAE